MWLPDDGFMWTETLWSRFYNFKYFNNLRILQLFCISWKIKCLLLLMHGATMMFQYHVRKRPPSVSNVSPINPFLIPVSLQIICTSSHLILDLRRVPAPTGLANKVQYVISLLPRTCYMLGQSHCLWLHKPNNILWHPKIMKLHPTQFSLVFCCFLPFRPRYLTQDHTLERPQLMVKVKVNSPL